jgi:hypothetical protein
LVVVEQEMSEGELLRIDEELQDPVLDDNAATHFGGIVEEEYDDSDFSDLKADFD